MNFGVESELSAGQCRYRDGSSVQILDIVQMVVDGAKPKLHQTENYLVKESSLWSKKGVFRPTALEKLLDEPTSLWEVGQHSRFGLNDRVPSKSIETWDHSLLLIKPEQLLMLVRVEVNHAGVPRSKLRAMFTYKRVLYCLAVTEREIEEQFHARGVGRYPLKNSLVCISLGETHADSYCYKLVAAVISAV